MLVANLKKSLKKGFSISNCLLNGIFSEKINEAILPMSFSICLGKKMPRQFVGILIKNKNKDIFLFKKEKKCFAS